VCKISNSFGIIRSMPQIQDGYEPVLGMLERKNMLGGHLWEKNESKKGINIRNQNGFTVELNSLFM